MAFADSGIEQILGTKHQSSKIIGGGGLNLQHCGRTGYLFKFQAVHFLKEAISTWYQLYQELPSRYPTIPILVLTISDRDILVLN